MSLRNKFLTRLLVSLGIVPKLQSVLNSNEIGWFAIADLGSKMSHFGTLFDMKIRHYTHFETPVIMTVWVPFLTHRISVTVK